MTGPRLGRVVVEGDRATLIFERHLPHPIETVWNAITNPDELAKWYLPVVKMERRVGGAIEYSNYAGRVTGGVLEWDPPHVFEHEWTVERSGSKGEYGVIRWELESAGTETILRLTHGKLPSKVARSFAPGVHAILDLLEARLGNAELPDWSKRQEELRADYSR